jgi:hypothetical protein
MQGVLFAWRRREELEDEQREKKRIVFIVSYIVVSTLPTGWV